MGGTFRGNKKAKIITNFKKELQGSLNEAKARKWKKVKQKRDGLGRETEYTQKGLGQADGQSYFERRRKEMVWIGKEEG